MNFLYTIHYAHNNCWSIGQTKIHTLELGKPIMSSKGSFWDVLDPDLKLMLT